MKTSVFLAPTCVLLGAAANAQVTSVASAAWDAGTTWSDGLAPAAGQTYQVTPGFTVDSPVATSVTFGGDALQVQGGGILRLRHTSDGGNTTVTANLQPLSLADGGAFQAYNTARGNVTRNVTSAIDFGSSGTVNLRIQSDHASAFTNRLNLQGVLSGTANVDLKGTLQGQTGERRFLSVSNAGNTLSGNWTVEGTNTTDNARRLFLEVAAANALGSGTVTLNTRSQLRVTSTGSINATSGITLATATSTLQLQNASGWVNSAAPLTVNGGAVALGAGASSIGSLSGTGGSITGGGVASGLTVNQTTNGTYAGSLAITAGNGLAFTKDGAADLRLTGTIDAVIPVTLNAGGLGLASPTIASLTQNGGSLLLGLDTAANDNPVITGNYAHSAGGITVHVATPPVLGTPYTLVTYQGTLTGSPPVTVTGLEETRVNATPDYGTGSNSTISVTFAGSPASLVWQGSSGSVWDINGTNNWDNGGSADKYFQFDSASFTDAATGTTNVILNDTVLPGAVTFDHSSKDYTLGGTGAIAGTATLTKSGTGTLTISNPNTYTGGTVISAGTLRLGTGGSLGTGAVANEGSLVFNSAEDLIFANLISGAGTVSQTGAGTVVLTADNTYTGGTTVAAGTTLQVGDGGAAGSLGDTTAVTNDGTLAFNRSGTVTVTAAITGAGLLVQNGPGTVILAGDSGYTGGTTIAGGTLQVGTNDLTGSLAGPVANNGIFALNRSDSFDFANVISGSGSFDHRGTGTIRLTGANSYTGTTGVSGGGRLDLDSAGSAIPAGTGLALANGTLDFNDLNLTVTSFTKAPAGTVDVIADPEKTLTVQDSFLANQGSLNLTAVDSLVFNNPVGSFNAVTTANNGDAVVTGAFINNTITAATFGVANGGSGGAGYTSSASVALGDTNVIHADTIAIGVNAAEMGTATLKCDVNDASITIRGTTGGTSRANMTVGYKKDSDYAGGSSSFEVSGANSTLDAMLGTLVIGRHSTGAGNFNRATSGTFAFGEGTLDATAIQLGIGEAPNIKTANGTLTTAGGLIRTETLTLVQDSGGAMGTATVNLAGDGALEVTNITGQAAANAIVHLADTSIVRNTPASNLTVTRTTLDVASTATAALSIGSGNDAFFDTSVFKFRYYSDTTAPDFGKLTVSGATILSDTSLTLVDENSSPVDFTVGQKFVIIDYAAGSLSGTFTGLADGATFAVGSQLFVIDYDDPAYGGKAVTLTVPEANTFAAWAAINAGGGGAEDDFDQDGVANAVEYLMGQTGSSFTANPQVVNGKITWPKDALAQATWVVQTSSNLAEEGQPGGWTNATVGVADLGSSIEFTLPTGDITFFVRLKVAVP